MTLPGAPLRLLLLFVAAGLFFVWCLYLFFPTSRINTLIAQELARQGLRLSSGAGKTMVPGLAWRDVLLSGEKGPLVEIREATLRPLLIPLVSGRPVLRSNVRLSAGRMEIEYGLKGERLLRLEADSIRLDGLPLVQTVLGGRAGGLLKGSGSIVRTPEGSSGEIRLEVQQLALSGVRLGGFALPDVSGLTSQGMVRVVKGAVRLESVTLQGPGIYMRLSGDLPGGDIARAPLNLTLEIMPKPEFLESQKLVFMLLAKFMVSPGVYRIPVRGTLLKPEIV